MKFASSLVLAAFYLLLATVSVFAEPPVIVTAPKGVKTIVKKFYISHSGDDSGYYELNRDSLSFDESGRLISVATEFSDRESWCTTVESKFVYELDEKGRVLKRIHKYNTYLQNVWCYEYQSNGAFSVTVWDTDVNDDLREDPSEIWQFNEKGEPLSMKFDDAWGSRRVKYKYADWLQDDPRKPTNGNGRLLSIIEDTSFTTKDVEPIHMEDFRIYTKDNRLEILYDYGSRGETLTKTEYDEKEEPKILTSFGNEIKDGKLIWCAPLTRYEYKHIYCTLHGIELKDQDIEESFVFNYPHKSETDWSLDYSVDVAEVKSTARKTVYQYEFTPEFLKESEKKEKEDKEGK